MSSISHRTVSTNGISMHVAQAGEGFPVLLCHGFPELWYSWRHQLRALAEAGFHAIAPDQRGYGDTDAPQAVDTYSVHHLVGDLTGLLDALGIEKAVVVGHDWGGIVAWQMALLAAHRVEAVVGINTPYFPRPPMRPTDLMRAMAQGNFHYVLYFQTPGVSRRPSSIATCAVRCAVFGSRPIARASRNCSRPVRRHSVRLLADCSTVCRMRRTAASSPPRISRCSPRPTPRPDSAAA